VLAIDFDRRKPRGKRAARHNMLGPDRMPASIEVHEVSGSDIDSARRLSRERLKIGPKDHLISNCGTDRFFLRRQSHLNLWPGGCRHFSETNLLMAVSCHPTKLTL
jgi:hypothetical protein